MTREIAPGTFFRIPLADGTFAYGRELEQLVTGFYDYRTQVASDDLDTIESKPLLFRHVVQLPDQLERWEQIGVRPLEGELTEPSVFFHQEIGDFRQCTIVDSVGNERPATPQECIGLEREGCWTGLGIEERLLAMFEGKPWGTRESRVRLE